MLYTFFCPKCGAYQPSYEENDNEISTCFHCKGKSYNTWLSQKQYEDLSYKEKEKVMSDIMEEGKPQVKAGPLYCPACKMEIPPISSYCMFCGEKIKRPGRCSNCNKDIPLDSTFCPFCGTPVEKEINDEDDYPVYICPVCRKDWIVDTGEKSSNCPECDVKLINTFFSGKDWDSFSEDVQGNKKTEIIKKYLSKI